MGKLSKVNKTYIKNFLRYNDNDIFREYSLYAAIGNIVALLGAMYYLDYMIVPVIIFSVMIVGIIISLLYFYTKVKLCKKNLYLYFGIYTMLFSISLGALAYGFLKDYFQEYSYIVLILLVFLDVAVLIQMLVSYKRKIMCNYYENHLIARPSKYMAAGSAGGVLGMICGRHEELLGFFAGVILVIGSVWGISFVSYLIKYYCFCLIGEVNTEFLNQENQEI